MLHAEQVGGSGDCRKNSYRETPNRKYRQEAGIRHQGIDQILISLSAHESLGQICLRREKCGELAAAGKRFSGGHSA